MTFRAYKLPASVGVGIEGTVNCIDIMQKNPDQLQHLIMSGIAEAVVAQVMKKLRPVLEQALIDAFQQTGGSNGVIEARG